MPTAKRTFRPPKSTVLTAALGWIGAFSLPAVIVLSLGVVPTGPRREIPLGGPARIAVAGLLFAAGLGGAQSASARVGITYSHDLVTVVNFLQDVANPDQSDQPIRLDRNGPRGAMA
jgi:hypothetical protein